ncbi:MAG TPA: DNA polymerase III subunit alpha, partial [Gammaproteobacteria bacterium]|nr:DNA polymerase III subunit alpha [Gammaproteobacteria bacterium]
MSLAPKFIHLRVHTEYSMVDGIVRIKPLMKKVAQTMPAVALTDQSNLFGMVKFYREALNLGIKPLIGVDSWVQGEEGEVSPIVLLCLNDEGYQNLTRLVSRSYQAGQQAGRAIIQRSWLVGQTEGLIALSGGRLGDIGQALLRGDREKALQATADWMGLFPDCFYLELQRTGRDGEETYLQGA